MGEGKRQIFRQQSLDKLSSPERLDQMLRIVKPQSWIMLMTFGLGACLVILWSIFFVVPETARGPAILVLPKQLTEFHAPAAGQIDRIAIVRGDIVQKGDVLATLVLPAVDKELEVARSRLAFVTELSSEITEEERALAKAEKASIAERRLLLSDRIRAEDDAAEQYRERNLALLDQQRQRSENSRTLYTEILTDIETEIEMLKDLVVKEFESEAALMEPRRDLAEIKMRLANLDVEEVALISREHEITESYELRKKLIEDLKLQLNDLTIRELEIDRRLVVDRHQIARDIEAITSEIGLLEARQKSEGQLLSEYAGTVTEITVAVGHQVAVGEVLGRMEIDDPEAELVALAYFSIKDGKKVKKGQEIRVTLATVERERFGGIVGVVESVSDYPVTIDAAEHQLGDLEIARTLLGGEPRIEVGVRLRPDPMSTTGYAWTSGTGPPDADPPTPGTTADVRVTLAERAPITLVLPFLKSMFGQ